MLCQCWWYTGNYKNKTITDTSEQLKNQLKHFGLTVNERKTKYSGCPPQSWSQWFPNIWNN